MKKRNTIILCTSLLILLSCSWYVYSCYHMSREKWVASRATIGAYSQYELRIDNKVLFSLGCDTTLLEANFVNQWNLLPSCRGLLLAEDNNALHHHRYAGLTTSQVCQAILDSLHTLRKNSQWVLHETDYYFHSHQVRDEGYGMIAEYAQQQKTQLKQVNKLYDSLQHAADNQHLRIVRKVSYKALFGPSNEHKRSLPCLMEKKDTIRGMNLFRLTTHALPDSIVAVNYHAAAVVLRLLTLPLRKSVTEVLKKDSTGVYQGERDSLFHPHGHGAWMGRDGSFYEGHWQHGQRNGFGVGIKTKEPLRVGEWKSGRYQGERLVYTSERIYGIDISKYQHIQGKKKFPILWNKLRINHLGNISRKKVSGNVSYPISFIYIKCTEGATLLNPYYRKDYQAARAHGFRVGSYHFFSTRKSGLQQARKFMKHAQVRRGDFPPVLDLEPTPRQIKQMGGPKAMFTQVRAWLRYVEKATGTRPILYISQMFVNRYFSMTPDLKRNYRVWIARYGEYKPDVRLVLWQLCPDGRVSGIRGHVDINVFNGYRDAYQKFLQEEIVK